MDKRVTLFLGGQQKIIQTQTAKSVTTRNIMRYQNYLDDKNKHTQIWVNLIMLQELGLFCCELQRGFQCYSRIFWGDVTWRDWNSPRFDAPFLFCVCFNEPHTTKLRRYTAYIQHEWNMHKIIKKGLEGISELQPTLVYSRILETPIEQGTSKNNNHKTETIVFLILLSCDFVNCQCASGNWKLVLTLPEN